MPSPWISRNSNNSGTGVVTIWLAALIHDDKVSAFGPILEMLHSTCCRVNDIQSRHKVLLHNEWSSPDGRLLIKKFDDISNNVAKAVGLKKGQVRVHGCKPFKILFIFSLQLRK